MSLKLTVGLLLSLLLLTPAARADLLVKDGQTIAFMGDSITQQGWDKPGGYVKLVTSGLQTLGVKITPVPEGIGGQTSREMVARISELIGHKPDLMTLSCGVNDVWHGAGGVDLETYKKNITSIVDQAQAAGIKVVILTSTPIGEDLPNENNVKLAAYNDFLRQLAKDRQLPLADESAAFQDFIKAAAPPAGAKILTEDGVHPIPPGHVLMAKTLLAALGATPDQIAKADQAWLDEPNSAIVSSIITFRVGAPITLRQYAAIKVVADQQKLSVNDLCNKLFVDAVLDVGKAHASDATPPNQSQVEGEAQKGFQAKVEALGKP